jgi:hypothetical protein
MNILADASNVNQYLNTSFSNPSLADPIGGRPGVDLTALDGQSLHMILAQGVGSFSVQWSYTVDDMRRQGQPDSDLSRPVFTGIRWWPSTDPDGNGTISDSDFGPAMGMKANSFGCYMRFPSAPSLPALLAIWKDPSGCLNDANWRFASTYFPKALKFTFTLYDSNGVFKEGKTFTHIVYLK